MIRTKKYLIKEVQSAWGRTLFLKPYFFTDRHTGRQTDRRTNRQADRKTDIQRDRQTVRQRNRQSDRQTR